MPLLSLFFIYEVLLMLDTVKDFMDEHMLHTRLWDMLDDKGKTKAINNATRILKTYLSKYYPNDIPVEHLAEQIMWMLRIDDSIQRAKLGVTYIQVDGISMNIANVDTTICPFIKGALQLSEDEANPTKVVKRKVYRYSFDNRDTFRGGCTC